MDVLWGFSGKANADPQGILGEVIMDAAGALLYGFDTIFVSDDQAEQAQRVRS
jgi:hypothetical protein